VHAENVSAQLYRLNWFLRAGVVEAKLRELKRAVKADFDPNQPRVPAGSGSRRSSPIGTNSGFITYTQQDQATAERWRDARVQNYPTVMNTEKIGGFGRGQRWC